MDIFYKLGSIIALAEVGITHPVPTSPSTPSFVGSPSTKKRNTFANDTQLDPNVENILPAKGLGGATADGVHRLYQSTFPKN